MIFVIFIFVSGCNSSKNSQEEISEDPAAYDAYLVSIDSWQENRIAGLKKNWLSLAGLFILKEGENTFGSSDRNDIIFPNSNTPDFIGSFVMKDGQVQINILPGIEVLNNGEQVTELLMQNDQSGSPTVLHAGSLRWHIIKRVDKIYVRLRDSENPDIDAFQGIERFPVDTLWRLKAQYEPHMTTKIIETTTTSGERSIIHSSGAVSFQIKGQNYRLDVWSLGDSGRYQTIFADETSGMDTYGAGRFITIEKSERDGGYIIDFNRAYNPPCAFTAFATCPIPPPQNRLPIRIEAGEKFLNGSH